MNSLNLGRRLIFGLIVIIGILAIASVSASPVDNETILDDDSTVEILQSANEEEVIGADEIPDVPDLFVNKTVYVDSNNIDDFFIDGVLDEKYSNKTLIFSGKFENLGKLVVDKNNVTLLGAGSLLKNVVFDVSGENITIDGFTFEETSKFEDNDGAAIFVQSNNVNLVNLNINYVVPNNVEAYGIFGVANSRNPIKNLRIANSTINFEGHNNNRDVYNCAIKLLNCHNTLIENNLINTSLPLRDVNFGAHGATLDSDYVMSIGLEGCDNFSIIGNTIISDVNKRPESQYPTLDGILVSQSDNSLIYNNTISLTDFVTQVGDDNYLYGIDVYALNNLTISKNDISIITRGGKLAAGTAYPIQVSGPIDLIRIDDNDLYSFSNGPNIGIYSQNYYGSTGLVATNNRINVTGLAGVHEWALVAGIETQDSNSTILNNTIEVHSVAPVGIDDNIYGVSYRQKLAGNHSFNIQNNTVFSDGFKSVYLLDSVDFNVKDNLLVSFNENATASYAGFDYSDLSRHRGTQAMNNNRVVRAEDYFTSIGIDVNGGDDFSYTAPTNNKNLTNKIDGSTIDSRDDRKSYSYNPLISDSSNSDGKNITPGIDTDGTGNDDGTGGKNGGESSDGSDGGININVDDGNGDSDGNSLSLRDLLAGFMKSDSVNGEANTTSKSGSRANTASNETDATPSISGENDLVSEAKASESPSISSSSPSQDSSASKSFEIEKLEDKVAFIPSIFYIILALILIVVGYRHKKSNFS